MGGMRLYSVWAVLAVLVAVTYSMPFGSPDVIIGLAIVTLTERKGSHRFIFALLFSAALFEYYITGTTEHDFSLLAERQQGPWKNNANTQFANATRYAMPTTEAELAAVIRESASVRVVGAGHSFTPLVPPDPRAPNSTIINLDRYARLLHVDKATRQATFEAGVRIRDMHALLAPHGLALPTTGAVHAQSIAGAMLTATHGSTRLYGSYASLVVAMRIIDANGKVHECSETINRDLFRAAKVSFGVVGVVSTVTLQLVDSFYLEKYESAAIPMETLFDTMVDDIRSNDYYFFYWLPTTQSGRAVAFNRVDRAPTIVDRAHLALQRLIIRVFSLLGTLEAARPAWRPALHGLVERFAAAQRFVGASHEILYVATLPDYRHDVEYYLPLEKCRDAMTDLIGALGITTLPLNGVGAVRFIPAEDGFLSPFYSENPDEIFCALDLFLSRISDERLSVAVDQMLEKYQPRVHWGKEHEMTHERIKATFPRFDDFMAQRKAMDPNGKFLNSHTRQLLGL